MGNGGVNKDHIGGVYGVERRKEILSKPLKGDLQRQYSTKLADWRKNESEIERNHLRQTLYHCHAQHVIPLDKIPIWSDVGWEKPPQFKQAFPVNEELNKRISLIRCDITHLEVGAVVNAANNMLLGGGGIDGAIHAASGPLLMRECAALNGLETGYAKITKGYKLPARYILHAVGPTTEDPKALSSCYTDVLEVAKEHKVRSVAFCCISTGIFGYPLGSASRTALYTVRTYLESNANYKHFDRIIFVVFLAKEELCYNMLLPCFFPVSSPKETPPDPVVQDELKDKQRKEELEKKKLENDKVISAAIKHEADLLSPRQNVELHHLEEHVEDAKKNALALDEAARAIIAKEELIRHEVDEEKGLVVIETGNKKQEEKQGELVVAASSSSSLSEQISEEV